MKYDFLYFRFVRIELNLVYYSRKPMINYACIKYASLIFQCHAMTITLMFFF